MAWFSRFTRFGDVHLVYGQEHDLSCGIASLMMCVFKINKLKPGKDSVTIEQDIIDKYEKELGSTYNPDTTGTWPLKLAKILDSFTDGGWKWDQASPNDVPQKLIDLVGVKTGLGPVVDVTPVILGVDFPKYAHWVVVDTIREFNGSKYATICDPWDTNVHLQQFNVGSPFVYDAASGGFMINFGGSSIAEKENRPYQGNAAKGQVKNWGIIYC